MIVDGKAIAEDIYRGIRNELTHRTGKPHLTVFTAAPDLATQKYLHLKKKKADQLGVSVNVIEFPEDIKTEEVVQSIQHASMATDGIIVQLPFPTSIDIDQVLSAVPNELDADGIHYVGGESRILPPVVGAIREIADRHGVMLMGKKVVVVGEGRLVGRPAAAWLLSVGAVVTVIGKETENVDEILKGAEVIISGAGVPGLITPERISAGVSIFDAGTSEDGGVLRGDADHSCADKCNLFTPVPGGIGPITVAILLRNLVTLTN